MVEIYKIMELLNYIEGLKAIIFDLDDTLYNEKEYVKSGYKAVGEYLIQVNDAFDKLWEAFMQKKPAIDEVLLSERIYSEELKENCLHIYRTNVPQIHLNEGVYEVIEYLRSKKIKIGIITDGRPEGQRAKIMALSLEKYFDEIIITDELGGVQYRKPNEKAFALMKERLGVEYAEMSYVGDNIRKDFVAPEKLGMKALWYKNPDGIYADNVGKK